MVLHVSEAYRTPLPVHAVFAVERLLGILMLFAVEAVAAHAAHPVRVLAPTSLARAVPAVLLHLAKLRDHLLSCRFKVQDQKGFVRLPKKSTLKVVSKKQNRFRRQTMKS